MVNGRSTKSFLRLAVNIGWVMNNLTRRQGPCYMPHHKATWISNISSQLQGTLKGMTDPLHPALRSTSPTHSMTIYTSQATVLTSNCDDMALQNYPQMAALANSISTDEEKRNNLARTEMLLIKNYMRIITKVPFENPTCDSQAKEQLTPSAGRLNDRLHAKEDSMKQRRPLGMVKLTDAAGQTSARRFPKARRQTNASQDTPLPSARHDTATFPDWDDRAIIRFLQSSKSCLKLVLADISRPLPVLAHLGVVAASISRAINSLNGRFTNTQVTSTRKLVRIFAIPELPQATSYSNDRSSTPLLTASQVELKFRASMNDQTNAENWSILLQEQILKPFALTQLLWNSCDKSMAPTPSLTIGMTIGDPTECSMGDLDAPLNTQQLFIEPCTCSGAIAHQHEELTKAIICWQHVIGSPPNNDDVRSTMGHGLWDDWLKAYMANQQALYFLPGPMTQYMQCLASTNPVQGLLSWPLPAGKHHHSCIIGIIKHTWVLSSCCAHHLAPCPLNEVKRSLRGGSVTNTVTGTITQLGIAPPSPA